MRRTPMVRLNKGQKVRLTNGISAGTVKLRIREGVNALYLIEWDNPLIDPSFEPRGHLIPLGE